MRIVIDESGSRVSGGRGHDGAATLRHMTDAPTPTYLVTVGNRVAGYDRLRAGVAGGVAYCSRGWRPVAYTDRAEFLRGAGKAAFLDEVNTLGAAVQALCRYWNEKLDAEESGAEPTP